MTDCFEVLGIEPTTEIKKIKRAYASKTRQCHPEEHPEEFRILHDAYEEALNRAKRGTEMPAFMESYETQEKTGTEAEQEQNPPDDEWKEAFRDIAVNSEEKGGLIWTVRRIMEECRNLYMNESERDKLYHWKDIFDEPGVVPAFRSREFVTAWYEFLESHHMFSLPVWQFFDSLDGERFSAEPFDIPRFPYTVYIEQLRAMPEMKAYGTTIWNPGVRTAGGKKKKRQLSQTQIGLLYIAGLGGMVAIGGVLGVAAGLIFG